MAASHTVGKRKGQARSHQVGLAPNLLCDETGRHQSACLDGLGAEMLPEMHAFNY